VSNGQPADSIMFWYQLTYSGVSKYSEVVSYCRCSAPFFFPRSMIHISVLYLPSTSFRIECAARVYYIASWTDVKAHAKACQSISLYLCISSLPVRSENCVGKVHYIAGWMDGSEAKGMFSFRVYLCISSLPVSSELCCQRT
jgi:hypothetical protein